VGPFTRSVTNDKIEKWLLGSKLNSIVMKDAKFLAWLCGLGRGFSIALGANSPIMESLVQGENILY